MKNRLFLVTVLFAFNCYNIYAQTGESPIKIFGYFQNIFTYETSYNIEIDQQPAKTSFSLQQLNIFFQTDISNKWSALVNFEFVNNFSASRLWGSADLDEAWIRYRANAHFNLKLGLQVPVFNRLNEIKNKTPLLPYAVRPLAYETSFQNFIAVDEYVPDNAFAQAYGFLGVESMKLDYALYVGNSPNINMDREQQQTGIDTTDTFLVGGRIGIRHNDLKFGVSYSRDIINGIPVLVNRLGLPNDLATKRIPRNRLGADISYYNDKFSFEAEFIAVLYDHNVDYLYLNKYFYYGTIGYRFHESLLFFISYWNLSENYTEINTEAAGPPPVFVRGDTDTRVPTIGLAFNINERTTLKAQVASVLIEPEIRAIDLKYEVNVYYYALAASVYF